MTTPSPAAAAPLPALEARALIELMRLASPALPVGGFSYSEGLEAGVDSGLVADEATARGWLLDQLHLGLARADLPLMTQAFDAPARGDTQRLSALNDWMLATRESAELALQSRQMGRSLIEWLRQRAAAAPELLAYAAALAPAPTWPVAFALAAANAGASRRAAAFAFAVGWAENMVAAAMRCVPLGQTAGQRLLDAIGAELPAAVDAALALGDEARQAFTPMLAILSSQHETQYSRIFRS